MQTKSGRTFQRIYYRIMTFTFRITLVVGTTKIRVRMNAKHRILSISSTEKHYKILKRIINHFLLLENHFMHLECLDNILKIIQTTQTKSAILLLVTLTCMVYVLYFRTNYYELYIILLNNDWRKMYFFSISSQNSRILKEVGDRKHISIKS